MGPELRRGSITAIAIVAALVTAVAACGPAPVPSPSAPATETIQARAIAAGMTCQPLRIFESFPGVSCTRTRATGELLQQVAIYARPDGTFAGLDSIIGLGTGLDPRAETLATFDGLLSGVVDGATVATIHQAIASAGPARSRTPLDRGGILLTQVSGDLGQATLLAPDLANVWGHPTPPKPSG